MIKASEAKEIAEASDANVTEQLKDADRKIREAATLGKRQLFWLNEKTQQYVDDSYGSRGPARTALQTRLMEALQAYGYRVSWSATDAPRQRTGFGSDPDDQRRFQTWTISISW